MTTAVFSQEKRSLKLWYKQPSGKTWENALPIGNGRLGAMNGEVHLLPAIPDVWQTGSISGIRAVGGFQTVSMEWKGAKVVKAVIRSTLGGNLSLRVPNAMKLSTGGGLKPAMGTNANPFYDVEETPAPVISGKASVVTAALKETVLYDLATTAANTYTLVAQ